MQATNGKFKGGRQDEKGSRKKHYALDEQTGQWFEVTPENRLDRTAAIISVVYLLILIPFFFWLLFDTWVGQNSIPNLLGYRSDLLKSAIYHQIAYTMIGGALGGLVNGVRSVLVWHSERAAFGQRFLWRYLAMPWIGSTLALFVYSLLLGGVVAFTGGVPQAGASSIQSLVAFAIGGLSGYGSGDVSKWLDFQVAKFFKVPPSTVKVPNLIGMTREDAEATLKTNNLMLGEVIEEAHEDVNPGLVVKQRPDFDSVVDHQGKVDITLSVTGVRVPNLVGLSVEAAAEQLRTGGMVLGIASEQPVADPLQAGAILKQAPEANALVTPGKPVDVVVAVPVPSPEEHPGG